jgi:hypothetical protein
MRTLTFDPLPFWERGRCAVSSDAKISLQGKRQKKAPGIVAIPGALRVYALVA